ncbi:uncharacterized protein LOC132265227 [Phlebotomus argentipes]|uniref:uncharacterized protein LOC132265227 n=1 Tax=Phlebotomus argentipes TaxID=94469 RepID=UPI0028931B90|nr:uncharacterized protein LOC132265227 [Phlebotomus argentipes]
MDFTQFLAALAVLSGVVLSESAAKVPGREKRWLAFPYNSATGVLVAIAVPLIIPHRNVFVSYNFEANYNMPTVASDLIPGPLDRLEIIERSLRSPSEALFSRKKVYKALESKLRWSGVRGRACLLRAICEEALEPICEHNGLIGDIIHIILTPSTSAREDLHAEFYRAEELGQSGDCSKYKRFCSHSILDYISKKFSDTHSTKINRH